MRKTFFFLVSFCLSGLLSVRAESCLVMQLRDGETHSYVLSQQPALTFGEGRLMLTSAEAEAVFELAEVENFHFDDTENGIRPLTDRECRFTYVDGVITVEGQQGQVLLTNLAGQPVQPARSGQTFTFDLNDQPQGTYLMRIGQQSIKLYHK